MVSVSLHRPRGPEPGLGPRVSIHEEPPRPEPRVNTDSVLCLLRPRTQETARRTRSRRTVARRSQVRVEYTSEAVSSDTGASVTSVSMMEDSLGSSSSQKVAFLSL